MATKITVKKKFIVNGREYKSEEEMPGNIRNSYRKAMAAAMSPGQAIDPAGSKAKIVVNGEEYRSVEEMPPESRRIYEGAMAAVEPDRNAGAWDSWETIIPATRGKEKFPSSAISPAEVEGGKPASFGSRVFIAGIVVLMLLALFYFLSASFR